MLFPYSVDVPMQRVPMVNWLLIGVTVAVSLYGFTLEEAAPWMLIGPGEYFTVAGLFGSLMSHADVIHLAGNMIFLFVFGNAINAKLGHAGFLACYAGLGAAEGLVWALLGPGAALGASGAIMGLLGMFIVLYPRNDVSVFYWFGFIANGTFSVSAWVVIGTYIAFDIWGLVSQEASGVAYLSHVVGAVCGFGLASALVLTRVVTSDRAEENLYELTGVIRE